MKVRRGSRPLLLPVLLFGLFVVWPPAQGAADAPGGFEDVPVPITDMDAVKRVGPLFEGLLPPQHKENIQAQWSLRNALKEKGNIPAEQEKLKALALLRRDLGRSGLPEVSSALAVEAAKLAAAGHGTRALELSRWAVRISPEEPGAQLAAAQVALRSGFDVLAAARALLAWPALAVKDPITVLRLGALLLLLAFPAALVTVLLVVLLAGLRSLRLLAHDLGHCLPAGPSDAQRGLLGLLLLAVPLVLPFGIYGVLVFWSLLFGPYLRLAERSLLICGLFLLLFSPGIARQLDRQLGLPDSTKMSVYRVQHGAFTDDDLDRVDQAAVAAPGDSLLRFTQALAAKRAGELYGAAGHLQVVLEKNPDHRQALVLKAILELAGHRINSGHQILQGVVKRWPDCAAAHFNLYRLAQVSVNEDFGGAEHLARAERLAEPLVDAVLADDFPGLNRFLLEDPLPAGAVLDWRGDGEQIPSRFYPASSVWLWGHLPPQLALVCSATSILCLLLFWVLLSRLRLAHACETCCDPLCRRCQPLVGQTSHCEICTPGLALFDGATLVPSPLREAAQRDQRERKNRRVALLALVAPGSGHVLQGNTLWGALLLFLWCMLWMRVLLPSCFFGELRSWGVFSSMPVDLAAGVAGLLLLLLGQWRVRRAAPEGGA